MILMNKRKNIILGYKDAYLNNLIDPDDYKKFLENPEIKENLDVCLNELRTAEEV